MNLISKLCVLFLAWTVFGFVGFWVKALIWSIRFCSINCEDLDELLAEFVNGATGNIFGFSRDQDVFEEEKRIIEQLYGEPFIVANIKSAITWPATFPHMDRVLGEGYERLVNKYGLKESEKSAS